MCISKTKTNFGILQHLWCPDLTTLCDIFGLSRLISTWSASELDVNLRTNLFSINNPPIKCEYCSTWHIETLYTWTRKQKKKSSTTTQILLIQLDRTSKFYVNLGHILPKFYNITSNNFSLKLLPPQGFFKGVEHSPLSTPETQHPFFACSSWPPGVQVGIPKKDSILTVQNPIPKCSSVRVF